jgi:putative serine protease PepD
MEKPSYENRGARTHVNQKTFLRRGAPVAAALALGAGAGAGVYAGLAGGGNQSAAPTVTVAAAQSAAATTTVSNLTQLYKDVTPGVVDITVTSPSSGGFDPQGGTNQAEGSGFVFDTSGHIVTNDHVVDGATSISVRFPSGKTAKATVVGSDPSTDIAVIKVDLPASELHPLSLGSSKNVQPGEDVVAIGSPFGLADSMTAGIVSAIGRTIQAPNDFSIANAIQTDAPINHGNSGGPLLDLSGKVIGVNAQIESGGGGSDGVGFAIPIDSVKSVVNTIVAGGKVEHAYIGIHVGDAADGSGAQIGSVSAGTPGAKAGLKAGDVVTAIDGKLITKADDLTANITAHAPNDKVILSVTRNGKTLKIDVTLGVRPS